MNTFTNDDLDVLIEMSLDTYDTFPIIIKKIREELNWAPMPQAIELAVNGLKRNNSSQALKILKDSKRL